VKEYRFHGRKICEVSLVRLSVIALCGSVLAVYSCFFFCAAEFLPLSIGIPDGVEDLVLIRMDRSKHESILVSWRRDGVNYRSRDRAQACFIVFNIRYSCTPYAMLNSIPDGLQEKIKTPGPCCGLFLPSLVHCSFMRASSPRTPYSYYKLPIPLFCLFWLFILPLFSSHQLDRRARGMRELGLHTVHRAQIARAQCRVLNLNRRQRR
jgi:hypothetical protein